MSSARAARVNCRDTQCTLDAAFGQPGHHTILVHALQHLVVGDRVHHQALHRLAGVLGIGLVERHPVGRAAGGERAVAIDQYLDVLVKAMEKDRLF